MRWSSFHAAELALERLDADEVIDGVLEWKKDIRIALVVIKVNDNVGNLGNQLPQYLALDWREVKEPIQGLVVRYSAAMEAEPAAHQVRH